MRGNVPIPELQYTEDVWLMVVVTCIRDRRTQQGKRFCDVAARNATGTITLKIWSEVIDVCGELKPGLWGITGKLESFQDRAQFIVAEYRPITVEQYREHQNADPCCRALTRWTSRRLRFLTFASESARNSSG